MTLSALREYKYMYIIGVNKTTGDIIKPLVPLCSKIQEQYISCSFPYNIGLRLYW